MARGPESGPMYRVAALLLSASAIRYAGQLVLLVLIARSLGATAVGTYTVALAVCAPVYILAGFGIRTVRLTLRRDVPTRTYERFLAGSLASAAALVGVVALFLPPQISVVLVVLAVLRTGETYMELYGAMLQRAGRPGAIVAVVGTGAALQVGAVAATFALGGGLVPALAGSAAAYLLVLLTVTRPLAHRSTRTAAARTPAEGGATDRPRDARPAPASADWRVLFASGLPTGIAIGTITLLSTVPQYLLGWVGELADAGRFAVLLYVVVAVEVLLHALAQSWIPRARRLLDHARLTPAEVARTAGRWTLLTGLPGLAGLGAAALLLPRVLDPEFTITPALALPLACTVLLVPASFAADTAVVVRNRYGLSLTVSVLALLAGTVVGAVLAGLGRFDLTAALWTFAVTMAVRALAGLGAVVLSAQRGQPVRLTLPSLPASAALVRFWPVLPIACAATALVAAGPRWALGAAAAVVLVVVLAMLRIGVASLLVLTVPLAFYVPVGGTPVNLAVSDLFLVLLFIRILVDPQTARAAAQVSGAVRTALCVLALLLALTAGTITVRSSAGAPTDWTALVTDSVKLLVVLAYFVVAVIVFRDALLRGRLPHLLTVWARTAAAVGALGTAGAILFATGVETGLTMDFRATGTFEDPNAFATYLILSIPLTLLAHLLTDRSLLSWHQVPLLAGVIASFSRGALVGLVAVLVVLCVLAFRDPALRALRLVVLLMVGTAVVLVLDGAAGSLFEGSRGVGFGEDVRFRLWAAAVEVWLHAPVMGVGVGQFIVASQDVLGSAGGVLAHNTYLSVLAEGGIVGAALLLTVPLMAVVALLRRGDTVAHLLLASGTGIAVMAVSLNLQNFRPIWLVLALALAWTAAPRGRDPSAAAGHGLGRGVHRPGRATGPTALATRTRARTEEQWN